MDASKPLHISSLVATVVLLGAGVANGYFLSSAHVQGSPLAPENPMNKTKYDTESDGRKSIAVVAKSIQKKAKGADAPEKKDSWIPDKVEDVHRSMDYAAQANKTLARAKYPMIAMCDHQLSKVFGKITEHWYLDWKLWVGTALWAAVWAKWLYYGYDEIYYQRALHAFGINIWILHELQYASTLKIGMIVVCIVLSIQTVFQTWVWYQVADPEDELADFDCDTLYLDLKLPGMQMSVLFIAQFGVWWFYMTSILGNFDFAGVNYLFWVWAYLVMQMTMIFNRGNDNVLGNPFPVHDVHRIMKNANDVTFGLLNEDGEVEGERFQISKFDIIGRGMTGFFCNAILRDIMAYTIPLMLMGFSEPMDFVVYCVGVNFICTLDDMTDSKYSMTPAKEPAEDPESTEASDVKTA